MPLSLSISLYIPICSTYSIQLPAICFFTFHSPRINATKWPQTKISDTVSQKQLFPLLTFFPFSIKFFFVGSFFFFLTTTKGLQQDLFNILRCHLSASRARRSQCSANVVLKACTEIYFLSAVTACSLCPLAFMESLLLTSSSLFLPHVQTALTGYLLLT